MTSVRRSLALTLSSQYVSVTTQFVTTIFISRLLSPAEVGVFAIGAAFAMLAQVLRDFGTGKYIVQEKELTTERIRAAFSVTLAFGLLAGSLMFLLAPLVAGLYEEPGVEAVLTVLAINFCLLPFGSITTAYLQRNMEFNKTVTIALGGTFTQAATSVGCAFAGLSYMSLAWGSLAGTIVTILLAGYFRPQQLPMTPGVRDIRRVLAFSASMSGTALLGQLSKSIPELIIGKMHGAAGLGVFSRGRGLIEMFETLVMRGVNPVLVPLFAQKDRAGDELHTSFLFGITCLTGLAWGFYGGLAVLAPELVLTLFGEAWLPSAVLVQIWCIAQILAMSIRLSGNLMVATGNVHAMLRRQLVMTPTGIGLTAIGATISLEAAASAGVLASVVWVALMLPKAMSVGRFGLADFLKALAPSVYPAIACFGAAYAVKSLAYQALGLNPTAVLLLAGAAGAGAWLATVFFVRHPLQQELASLARKILRRG